MVAESFLDHKEERRVKQIEIVGIVYLLFIIIVLGLIPMANLKQPPEFDGGDNYSEWRNHLKAWRCFTKEEKKRQGPALYLVLKGEARDADRSLAVYRHCNG